MTTRTLVMNLGSTSTKVAYYEDLQEVHADTIRHPAEDLAAFRSVFDQLGLRERAVQDWVCSRGLRLDDMDAIVSRGGLTRPVAGGVYEINEAMVAQATSGRYGVHPCSVGTAIALDLSRGRKAVCLTVDTPTMDEFEPLARYSGLVEVPRESKLQALNHRAMARHYAETIGKAYEQLNLVVVMLGGGISVAAHHHGRMIDATDGIQGDGAFSNNRCCGLPTGALVRLCYSGRYDLDGMLRHINGEAGLMSYLGTTDSLAVEQAALAGDERSQEVLEAMCYQTAKDIGACATVLRGQVDAILLVGGMANSQFITGRIEERVGFIAPVVVMPGEREMQALADGAYRALRGEVPIQHFDPDASALASPSLATV